MSAIEHVLVVERDSENQGVYIGDMETLKVKAEELEGGVLSWQDFYGELGAHSERDDELGYSIYAGMRV